MFNDERINAECGRIYSTGILTTVLITFIYALSRTVTLSIQGKMHTVLTYRDPEKFCVKVNKYFQSDETQSMRKNLKGSIFYGKSIERNVERVCEQPAFYQHNGDHEQHERIV